MDIFKAKTVSLIGPGGISCPCCNNYHCKNTDRKGKKALRRAARAALRNDLIKQLSNPDIF